MSFAIIKRIGMINGSVIHARNMEMRLSSGPNISETIILASIAMETASRITAMKLAKKCKNVNIFTVLSE